MAPLPATVLHLLSRSANAASEHLHIPGLSISSLELDQRSTSPSSQSPHLRRSQDASPNTVSRIVSRAAASTYTPCAGCKPVEAINNKFYFALFAIIAVAMVGASLWFFFWAKNGGFQWQEGDWDDYKSTVLRRKGPDGKTLSNATRSTKLGGGSVVHGQARWAAKSVIARDEKGRKGILGKRGFGGSHSIGYSDDFTQYNGGNRMDEMSEVSSQADRSRRGGGGGHHSKRYRDKDIKHYRHEKAAKVGGMNRSADGSHFDYSDTMTERSTEPLTNADKKRTSRAEKKAEEEATRMERKWRQEAERAAAILARENEQQQSKKQPAPRKSSSRTPSPAKKPTLQQPQSAKRGDHRRRTSTSRTPSPRKRDYSFSGGPAADEISTMYSAPYTSTTTTNTAETARSGSYYDSYRPHHQERRQASRSRHSSPQKRGGGGRSYDDVSDAGTKVYEHRIPGLSKERSSSPVKKSGGRDAGGGGGGGRDVMAGYRRGRRDTLDESDDE